MYGHRMFHLDLGSVPDWIGGLALPLAFIGLRVRGRTGGASRSGR